MMEQIITIITTPFKHGKVLWGIFTLLLAFLLYQGRYDAEANVILFVASISCAILFANLPPRYLKAIAPVLFCVSFLYLVISMVLLETFSWQGGGPVTVAPQWIAVVALVLTLPAIASNDSLSKMRKQVFVAATAFALLVLIGAKDVVLATYVSFALSIAFYICGIAKRKIRIVLLTTIFYTALSFAGIMLIGKPQAEISNEGIAERAQYLHRIDHWKEIITHQDTGLDTEYLYTIFGLIPVLLACTMVFITIRKLEDSPLYVKLLGITSSCVVVAFTIDCALTKSAIGASPIIAASCLYGIVQSCILTERRSKAIA